MAKFLSPETTEKIKGIMFGEKVADAREQFLREELSRYVPQLAGMSEEGIASFVEYQRHVYLHVGIPEIGRPIASFNPTFADSVGSVQFSVPGGTVYTRASRKENGYRLQLHIGPRGESGFSRQFTRYDLRMFPELKRLLSKLPVMIGDTELVNRRHIHLAGFHRVELRIPNQTHWPRPGQDGLSDEFIAQYLADRNLFLDGESLPDTELTLVFHGLFAIADPATWDMSREDQMKSLISLCNLPVDHKRIDELLDQLAAYLEGHSLNARVVERFVPSDLEELSRYVVNNECYRYEGTCVVQSVWKHGKLVIGPRSVKIKAYETLDCILLGLYLRKTELGLVEENVIGALVGLYDEMLGVYLPAAKVNLDPDGVQIKTAGQKRRLQDLRKELVTLVPERVTPGRKVHTLHDAFRLQGKNVLKYLFGEDVSKKILVDEVLERLPARSDIAGLCEMFRAEKETFCGGTAKLVTVPRKFVYQHLAFFQAVDELDKKNRTRFLTYFGRVKQIKETSTKLVQPQVVVYTGLPIILETQVFDVKWGASPHAAGFHSWFGTSFYFNNCFAERVRHDKSTTTDYATVHSLARANTPKRPSKRTKKQKQK